jgi:hypothetical protein
VALQLLRYMVRFWEQQVSAGQFPLPPIMPLVVYHGERTWPYPTTFEALVEVPAALRPYLPHFNYYLSDFSHLSDETIQRVLQRRFGDMPEEINKQCEVT